MPSIFSPASTKHLMLPQNSIPPFLLVARPNICHTVINPIHHAKRTPSEKNKALFKNYTQIMRNSVPVCAASPHVLAELY